MDILVEKMSLDLMKMVGNLIFFKINYFIMKLFYRKLIYRTWKIDGWVLEKSRETWKRK